MTNGVDTSHMRSYIKHTVYVTMNVSAISHPLLLADTFMVTYPVCIAAFTACTAHDDCVGCVCCFLMFCLTTSPQGLNDWSLWNYNTDSNSRTVGVRDGVAGVSVSVVGL